MTKTKVSDLFEVSYGNSFELVNLDNKEPDSVDVVNFVSRTEKNNGVSGYVSRIGGVKPFEAGLITVAGSGNSVLESFVQPKEFYTGFHVFILRPKAKMTEIEKQFYCFCIKQNRYRYSFGRQANKTLGDLLIPSELPKAWKTIEMQSLVDVSKKPKNSKRIVFNTKEWKYFRLSDYFGISASRDELVSKLDIETDDSGTPYVTSTDKNNGVSDYVKEEATNPAGTITANRGGSVGYFYYQPKPYKATPVDVRILTPKFELDEYVGLFLKTVFQLEKTRFNYSRKMGSDRISNLKVKLPEKNGQPDWNYMSEFIRSLPYSSSL